MMLETRGDEIDGSKAKSVEPNARERGHRRIYFTILLKATRYIPWSWEPIKTSFS